MLTNSRRGPAIRRSDHEQNESGAAALEFALVVPILLLLVVGVVSLGHGLSVRSVLSGAAYDAARTCALQRTPTQACARNVVQGRLAAAGGAGWCNAVNVTVRNTQTAGIPTVRSLAVSVNCAYRGVIAQGFLRDEGLEIAQLQVQAAMPY